MLVLLVSSASAGSAHVQLSAFQPLNGGFGYFLWALFPPSTGVPPRLLGRLTPSATGLVDETVTFDEPIDSVTGSPILPISIFLSIEQSSTPTIYSNTIAAAGTFTGVSPDVNGDYVVTISYDSTDACGAGFDTSDVRYFIWSFSDADPTLPCAVWYINSSNLVPTDVGFSYQPGLMIPDLPSSGGWKYQGWVVSSQIPGADIGGTMSTGKFTKYVTDPSPGGGFYKYGPDEDGAGANAGPLSALCCGLTEFPQFPGQEWVTPNPIVIVNSPGLSPYNVFISVEPEPDDNEATPYGYQPFFGTIDDSAAINSQRILSFNDNSMGRGTITYTSAASAVQLGVAVVLALFVALLAAF